MIHTSTLTDTDSSKGFMLSARINETQLIRFIDGVKKTPVRTNTDVINLCSDTKKMAVGMHLRLFQCSKAHPAHRVTRITDFIKIANWLRFRQVPVNHDQATDFGSGYCFFFIQRRLLSMKFIRNLKEWNVRFYETCNCPFSFSLILNHICFNQRDRNIYFIVCFFFLVSLACTHTFKNGASQIMQLGSFSRLSRL